MAAIAAPMTPGTADTIKEQVKQPLVLLSATALSFSWKFLIPSFGLTLLYLNLHFLGRYFAHAQRLFSRFGYGLFGKPPRPPSVAAEYGEIIALLVLDGILAFVIMLVLTLIAAVAWAVSNPVDAAVVFGQAFIDSVIR